jgi:hypothetical protein
VATEPMDVDKLINDIYLGLYESVRATEDKHHPSPEFVELLIEYLKQCWGSESEHRGY